MAIIRLENEFSSNLATKFSKVKMYHSSDVIKFLNTSTEIQNVYNNLQKLLNKKNYAVLKNINLQNIMNPINQTTKNNFLISK